MSKRPDMPCDECRFRKFAKESPHSLLHAFWVWHTSFCPGWKRYVKTRFEHGDGPPEIGHRRGYWEE